MVDHRTDDVTSLRGRREVVHVLDGVTVGDSPGVESAIGIGPQIDVRRVAMHLDVAEHDHATDRRLLSHFDDDATARNEQRFHRTGCDCLDAKMQNVTEHVPATAHDSAADDQEYGCIPEDATSADHHGVAPCVVDGLDDGVEDADTEGDGETVGAVLAVGVGLTVGLSCSVDAAVGAEWIDCVAGNERATDTRTVMVVVLVMSAPTPGATANIAKATLIAVATPAITARTGIGFSSLRAS